MGVRSEENAMGASDQVGHVSTTMTTHLTQQRFIKLRLNRQIQLAKLNMQHQIEVAGARFVEDL
jgi:hypothetical protein